MIVDPSKLLSIQSEWQGVLRMRDRVRHLVLSTFAYDEIHSPSFGNILYNLPLVLAFDVLTQVLLLARDEDRFTKSQPELPDLMDSAKTSLPWIDWQLLRDGVRLRNEVRHNGKLFGDIQCVRYIADIEAQLVAWGIIATAEPSVPASVMSFR